jgi:hypothetical protein
MDILKLSEAEYLPRIPPPEFRCTRVVADPRGTYHAPIVPAPVGTMIDAFEFPDTSDTVPPPTFPDMFDAAIVCHAPSEKLLAEIVA